MLTSRHEFSFEDFIESIVYSQEDLYIDIYDLERMLKNMICIMMKLQNRYMGIMKFIMR